MKRPLCQCSVCRLERRFRLRKGVLFALCLACAFALGAVSYGADFRVHNATGESIVASLEVTIDPGEIEAVTVPGNVLLLSRTTVGGVYESWAVDAEDNSLISLRAGGASEVHAESVDRLAIVMKGFTFMTLLELTGLILRIVRKIKSPTTAV